MARWQRDKTDNNTSPQDRVVRKDEEEEAAATDAKSVYVGPVADDATPAAPAPSASPPVEDAPEADDDSHASVAAPKLAASASEPHLSWRSTGAAKLAAIQKRWEPRAPLRSELRGELLHSHTRQRHTDSLRDATQPHHAAAAAAPLSLHATC